MQSLQNVHVLRVFVSEREETLRRTLLGGRGRTRRRVRRWLGRQLVSLGARVAAEPAGHPALAR
jgi:hypothetical protein